MQPLPELLRPKKLIQVVGQDHLLAEDKPLSIMVAQNHIVSSIFWGPAGCGKTSIARLLANQSNDNFVEISAVFAGVSDLKKIFVEAEKKFKNGQKTILFVDEIHRFNKSQQDAFLPVVEKGIIILIGASTENPSFSLNSSLLSRCRVFVLNRLSNENLIELRKKAEKYYKRKIKFNEKSEILLHNMSDGDGRFFLNLLEEIFLLNKNTLINKDIILNLVQRKSLNYDKSYEEHYNLISALHKSLRASDTDASLYWLARMLLSGEDPNYILRRLLRFSIEDIGLADPQSNIIALSSWQTFERLGQPEGELAIVQLVIYLSTSPKSNSSYLAWKNVETFTKSNGSFPPPKKILNASTKLMNDLGYGKGYIYDHNLKNSNSGQNCFPEELSRKVFYNPNDRGFEREIKKRLNWWSKNRVLD